MIATARRHRFVVAGVLLAGIPLLLWFLLPWGALRPTALLPAAEVSGGGDGREPVGAEADAGERAEIAGVPGVPGFPGVAGEDGLLLVTVADEAGASVAGIGVRWTSSEDGGRVSQGRTDAAGAYRAAPGSGVSLRVTVAGQEKAADTAAGPARVSFVVRRFRTISVLVQDEDALPVAGAEVLLANKAAPDRCRRAGITGPDGRCLVTVYDTGCLVSARKDGWVPCEQIPATAAEPVRAAPVAECEIPLLLERIGPGDRARGIVHDAAGRPVAGVRLTWQPTWQPARRHGFLTRAPVPSVSESGPDGRFTLLARGEGGTLTARKKGFAALGAELVPTDYAGDRLAIVLEKEWTVTGQVVDGSGAAVLGAQVRVSGAGGDPQGTWTRAAGTFAVSGLRPSPDRSAAGTPFMPVASAAPSNPATAKEEPGFRVAAFHPSIGRYETWVPSGDSSRRVAVRVVLSGEKIQGVVRRRADPVAFARIAVEATECDPLTSRWRPWRYSVLSRAGDGRFDIVRPSRGSWCLELSDTGNRFEPVSPPAPLCEFDGEEVPSFCDFDLHAFERLQGEVGLQVVDADGGPVSCYWLRLHDGRTPRSLLCTDSEGRLQAKIATGVYEITITPWGGSLFQHVGRFDVRPGARLDLGEVVALAPGTIAGTLEPLGGGRQEPGAAPGRTRAVIVADDPRSSLDNRISCRFGDWRIGGLTPGSYTLRPGERSGIDFDAQQVEVIAGATAAVHLSGRPCWRGPVMIDLRAASGAGPWTLGFRNCRGEWETRRFDAALGGAMGAEGWVRVDGLHLRPGRMELRVEDAAGAVSEYPVDVTGRGQVELRLR